MVFPAHGVPAHFYGRSCMSKLMVQEIPLTQPLLLRENHGCRSWPDLSCYAREGTAVRVLCLGREAQFPGHNTLTAVPSPIQIKLSLDNSSDSRPVKRRTKR